MIAHPVATQEEWLAARRKLLEKEKEWTRAKDELSRMRRDLPWVKVDKQYVFESTSGLVTLGDLFDGRSQLIVWHFMFGPGWEEGCDGCSFVCDHVDCARQHFEHHDISFTAVSRAPLAEFLPFKERMGWTFQWVSSFESDFNYDFGVSYRREDLDSGPVLHNFTMQKLNSEEQPGLSVFYRDGDGVIYHTYSTYERGGDILIGAYNFIDLTPIGRNEKEPMDWMKLHYKY